MTLLEAISARHSVRRYTDRPLDADVIALLTAKIEEINTAGGSMRSLSPMSRRHSAEASPTVRSVVSPTISSWPGRRVQTLMKG